MNHFKPCAVSWGLVVTGHLTSDWKHPCLYCIANCRGTFVDVTYCTFQIRWSMVCHLETQPSHCAQLRGKTRLVYYYTLFREISWWFGRSVTAHILLHPSRHSIDIVADGYDLQLTFKLVPVNSTPQSTKLCLPYDHYTYILWWIHVFFKLIKYG